MRITQVQRRALIEQIRRSFGPAARVWLFGSRADDRRRGGDVDIYVEAVGPAVEGRLDAEIATGIALQDLFDGLKVDLVVRYGGEAERPIHAIAKNTGVLLDER
ncbi:MAG: nucleotidyltransferase domain-containing protein [Gammaproteobacteria bacterium]